MPLKRSTLPYVAEANGDVSFTMTAPDGAAVRCEADRDYLVAVAPSDEARPTKAIFEEMRDLIELTASEQYDLHGTDGRGVIRLAPLIF
jgi:hypothetical protein